ncbi:hypothetical protein HAX54_019863, partial [Datura stramonium]|nr:hypothetical protein [Datura stramonium]
MAGSVTWANNPTPRRIVLCLPDPYRVKICLVISRLQHVRLLTPHVTADVSRTERRLTCT